MNVCILRRASQSFPIGANPTPLAAPESRSSTRTRKEPSSTRIQLMLGEARSWSNTYNYFDLVPKGRDEDDLPFTMAWVRHHDLYETRYLADADRPYWPAGAIQS
jgi:hypothetical protein